MLKLLATQLFFSILILNANANTVLVNASIKELTAGKWIYYREQGGANKRDSVQSFKGGFKFKIDVAAGEGDNFLISIEKNYDDKNSYISLFLDKGIITILSSGADFKDAKLSGSAAINDLHAYKTFMNSNAEIKKLPALYEQGNELYQAHDTAGLNKLQEQINVIDSISKNLDKQWIAKHTSSPISAVVLGNLRYSLEFDELEKMYNKLTATATNNIPAKSIKHSIDVNKLTGIGKPALEFTQTDTAGKAVSLKDFRGKYVLLDFWASWCGPCREENPNVVAAYNQYKDKNFTVLSVSLDQPTGKEKWMNAIHKDGLTWTHVSDLKFWSNAVAREYAIESIPTNFLLDPNGIIIGKDLRGDALNNKLAEVLK